MKRNLLEQALDKTAAEIDKVNTNPQDDGKNKEDWGSVPYDSKKCKCPNGYHDMFIECRGY